MLRVVGLCLILCTSTIAVLFWRRLWIALARLLVEREPPAGRFTFSSSTPICAVFPGFCMSAMAQQTLDFSANTMLLDMRLTNMKLISSSLRLTTLLRLLLFPGV
jgi:hypothetical protein